VHSLRQIWLPLLAAALGCGGGASEYRLGMAGPFTEGFGEASKRGAELAVLEINAAGGIGGAPLTIDYLDDQGDGSKAAQIAQAFVDDPRISGVVGHITSGAMVAAAYVYDGKLSALATTASSAQITGISRWVFRVISSDSANGVDLARFAERIGKRRAMVLYENDAYGRGLADAFRRTFTGEVLGFAGLVGSGREEVASSLFGATPRFAGKVLVNKKKVFASPRDSVKAGLALVPADRKSAGLDPQERLVEHVPLPRLGSAQRRFRLRHRHLRQDVAQWVEQLDVQPPLLGRRMEKFSGGNQQKAVLARWLRTEPKVLLLDEPTQGVDVGAKAAIYQQITDAASRGLGVIIASSDAEELVHLCHRVLIMRSGAIAAELTGPTLTEERLVAETLGATSHRKNMRTNLDPITFTVIRDTRDAITVTPSDGTDLPRRATVSPSRAGKFAQWVRRTSDRLRGRS
jgi:ABC-type multidrug transport system ATPase subunit